MSGGWLLPPLWRLVGSYAAQHEIPLWAEVAEFAQAFMPDQIEKAKETMVNDAASDGDLSAIQWARKHDLPWNWTAVCKAAKAGCISILEWIYQDRGMPREMHICHRITGEAFGSGKMDVARWVIGHGFPIGHPAMFEGAVLSRSMEMVDYAFKLEEPDEGLQEYILATAVSTGWLELLKQLKKRGFTTRQPLNCSAAAGGGHLETLKWLKENYGCNWNYCFYTAARGGHMNVLQWLMGHKPPPKDHHAACSDAAAGGHLEIVKWLYSAGYVINEATFMAAARSGKLEMVQWLQEQDCLWNSNVTDEAARGGSLKMLQWLVGGGCPVDRNLHIKAAIGGNLDMLKWIMSSNDFRGRTEHCLKEAIDRNYPDMVEWLSDQGAKWKPCYLYRAANLKSLKRGIVELTRVKRHQKVSCNRTKPRAEVVLEILMYAVRNDRYAIVKWVLDTFGNQIDIPAATARSWLGGTGHWSISEILAKFINDRALDAKAKEV